MVSLMFTYSLHEIQLPRHCSHDLIFSIPAHRRERAPSTFPPHTYTHTANTDLFIYVLQSLECARVCVCACECVIASMCCCSLSVLYVSARVRERVCACLCVLENRKGISSAHARVRRYALYVSRRSCT